MSFEQDLLGLLDGMYRVAVRFCEDPHAAEDLVQDTYLKAWRHRERFRPGTSLRAWLFRILKNTFLNEATRKRVFDRTVDPGSLEAPVTPLSAADAGFSDPVTRALQSLPERQRLVLLLADVEEWAYEDIAEVLECPKNTVGTLLRRTRAEMKAKLTKEKITF